MAEISRSHIKAINAIFNGDVDAFKSALRHIPGSSIDLPLDGIGTNLLLASAKIEGHQFMDAVLQRGADPHYSDASGRTAMLFKAKLGDTESMLIIGEAGGSMLHTDNFGNGVGHCAVEGNSTRALDLAIDVGVDMDKGNLLGRVPLHTGASGLKIYPSKYMLDNKIADPNKTDVFQETPVFSLMRSPHKNIRAVMRAISVFVEGGASLEVRNLSRQNPLQVADTEGRRAVAAFARNIERFEKGIESDIIEAEKRVQDAVTHAISTIKGQIRHIIR